MTFPVVFIPKSTLAATEIQWMGYISIDNKRKRTYIYICVCVCVRARVCWTLEDQILKLFYKKKKKKNKKKKQRNVFHQKSRGETFWLLCCVAVTWHQLFFKT